MIVAPGCDRGPDEDAVDEKGGRDLLQPQPGMTDGAREDVERDRSGEAEQRDPAQDHQKLLERIESRPFEVALPLQHELFGELHLSVVRSARADLRPVLKRYLMDEISRSIRSACGPSCLASFDR